MTKKFEQIIRDNTNILRNGLRFRFLSGITNGAQGPRIFSTLTRQLKQAATQKQIHGLIELFYKIQYQTVIIYGLFKGLEDFAVIGQTATVGYISPFYI